MAYFLASKLFCLPVFILCQNPPMSMYKPSKSEVDLDTALFFYKNECCFCVHLPKNGLHSFPEFLTFFFAKVKFHENYFLGLLYKAAQFEDFFAFQKNHSQKVLGVNYNLQHNTLVESI